MVRTLISLSEEEKTWLDQYSRFTKTSIAKTIRQAIHLFRAQSMLSSEGNVLQATAGLWKRKKISGDKYVEKLRKEWDHPDDARKKTDR